MERRGQLSLSVVEAGIGVVLILAVAMSFALGTPAPDERTAQLDRYAEDTMAVLADEPPRHADSTRLSEIVRSSAAFDRESTELERRVERILPENLMFQVETQHGSVGYPRPGTVETGTATATTVGGEIVLRVWYV